MMRGIEMNNSAGGVRREAKRSRRNTEVKGKNDNDGEAGATNQSILVSGESGAGKTVTAKIVLNYFAMLSSG